MPVAELRSREDSTVPPRRSLRPVPPREVDILSDDASSDGTRFGDYELLEEIARGGMGIVYRARQRGLNRIVALKMILAGRLATDSEVRRFYSEAEAAASLNHAGIVQVYEVGQVGHQHFFSMEFIDGPSLSELIGFGPLEPARAAAIMASASEAVAFAHRQGVVHRDIKPGNILLDAHGAPHLTDFGLAGRTEAQSDSGSGEPFGTVSYMPPEQAAGQTKQTGPRSDVYSLGATLYCLLAGHPPFRSAHTADTLLQVISVEPVPLRRLNPRIPRDLETICLKCLEKQPSRRYVAADVLAADLRRFLNNEPILARPTGVLVRFSKWVQRNPALALLAMILLATIAALFASTLMYNQRLAAERELAVNSERRTLELLSLTENLVADIGQRRDAEAAVQLQRLMNFGRLYVIADRLTRMPGHQAVAMRHQFQEEAQWLTEQDSPVVRDAIERVQTALADWDSGVAPLELQQSVTHLLATCCKAWRDSLPPDGVAAARVKRLIAGRAAHLARQLQAATGDKARVTSEQFDAHCRGPLQLLELTALTELFERMQPHLSHRELISANSELASQLLLFTREADRLASSTASELTP